MPEPASNFWYVLQSSNNALSVFEWGIQSDRLVPADYDGDGRTDIGVYRPSGGNWLLLRSGGNALTITNFGAPDDKPVPASFLP